MVWTTHILWVIWCGVHIWCGQRYGVDYMYPRDIKVLSTGYIWCGPYGVGDLRHADALPEASAHKKRDAEPRVGLSVFERFGIKNIGVNQEVRMGEGGVRLGEGV